MCQICQKIGRTAPAEGTQIWASPSPNVRRDKISRSGKPPTLILSLRTLGLGLDRFGPLAPFLR